MSGGRPKNIEISSDSPEVIALINHINDTVLQGKRDINSKAKYLSDLAKEKGYRLAESELKNNFFSPFKNGNVIQLSRSYVERIDGFLRDVKDEYGIDISILWNFKQRYAPDEISESKPQKKSSDMLSLLFKNKLRLNHLEDTEWILFERYGDKVVKGADWGIGIGRVKFTDLKNYLHVEMNTVYKNINRTYQGLATQDAQKCLFVDLLKIEDNTRSNLVLQLVYSDVQEQSLLIGHYSFYSSFYDHILSKTIVLLKILKEPDENNKKNYLPIGNYSHSSSDYKAMSQEIRSFLYSRDMNRMSLPNKKIGDLLDLRKFLEDHRHSKINAILKKHFVDDYRVYYKRSDSVIVEDDLKVYHHEDAIKLMAKYIHKPDVDKKHNKTWIGEIFINDSKSGISLELSNEKSKRREEQEDPILLTFWIPPLTITFHESQCYAGVISGLEDSSKGPIGFVCLAVKKNVNGFQGVDDLRVKKYFEQQDSWMLQPKAVKFKLDDFLD